MDEATHPILKQYVNLLRLDHGSNFADPVSRMSHRLTDSVSAAPVVGSTGFGGRGARAGRGSATAFESAAGAALWTGDAGNLSPFSN